LLKLGWKRWPLGIIHETSKDRIRAEELGPELRFYMHMKRYSGEP